MEISAKKIQEWCNGAISSLAWQRVVVKALPKLREQGLELSDLMNPDGLMLSDKSFEIIASTIAELYQVEVPTEYAFT